MTLHSPEIKYTKVHYKAYNANRPKMLHSRQWTSCYTEYNSYTSVLRDQYVGLGVEYLASSTTRAYKAHLSP